MTIYGFPSCLRAVGLFVALSFCATAQVIYERAGGETQHATGQDVAPVFEGWERNVDGTFNLVFGYMNRNYMEELDIPIGPDNKIEPGRLTRGADPFLCATAAVCL